MDVPDTIPDSDVLACRRSGFTGAWHLSHWRLFWSYTLGRALTDAETRNILGRINGYGPHKREDTWEYLLSLPRPEGSFWQSQV